AGELLLRGGGELAEVEARQLGERARRPLVARERGDAQEHDGKQRELRGVNDGARCSDPLPACKGTTIHHFSTCNGFFSFTPAARWACAADVPTRSSPGPSSRP